MRLDAPRARPSGLVSGDKLRKWHGVSVRRRQHVCKHVSFAVTQLQLAAPVSPSREESVPEDHCMAGRAPIRWLRCGLSSPCGGLKPRTCALFSNWPDLARSKHVVSARRKAGKERGAWRQREAASLGPCCQTMGALSRPDASPPAGTARLRERATVSAAPAQLLSAPRPPFHIISRAGVEQVGAATFAGCRLVVAGGRRMRAALRRWHGVASLPGVRNARHARSTLSPSSPASLHMVPLLPHHPLHTHFVYNPHAAPSCPLSTGLRLCIVHFLSPPPFIHHPQRSSIFQSYPTSQSLRVTATISLTELLAGSFTLCKPPRSAIPASSNIAIQQTIPEQTPK
jgi:hypothetical protein